MSSRRSRTDFGRRNGKSPRSSRSAANALNHGVGIRKGRRLGRSLDLSSNRRKGFGSDDLTRRDCLFVAVWALAAAIYDDKIAHLVQRQ
jgi:hypothetical protein